MKLHTKLYIFFAVIVIVPLVAVTAVSGIVLGRSGRQTYETRMQSGLAAASSIISGQQASLVSGVQAWLQRWGGQLVPGPGAPAALEQLRAGTGAQQVTLTDAAGRVIGSSGAPATVGSAGMTESTSSGAGAGSAGNPNAGPDAHVIELKAAVPIAGTQPLEVIAVKAVDTADIDSVFSSQDVDWGFVSGGKVMAGAGSLPAGAVSTTADEGGSALLSGSGQEAALPAFDASISGQDMLATGLGLPDGLTQPRAAIVAAVRASAAGAASARVLEAGLVAMALTLAVGAALGFFLTRNITGPLRQLASAVSAGIRGDLDRKVDIRSRDEIGVLGASFNEMQANLRAHIDELEKSRSRMYLALSYAGDILGATADRERLITTTAEAARLASGAEGIWLQLLASDGQTGHPAMTAGVPEGYFQGGRDLAAIEAAGLLLAGGIEPDEMQESAGGAAVAYPLLHGRRALGCLVAVFDHDNPPSESQRHILSSLATQAASALENINFGELQQQLAITDPMTSLSNFRYLESYLDREVNKSRRYGRTISMALLDLDDFKRVNDTFGHPGGDELLRAVAAALTQRVRSSDLVARYGGEEFAIVFPETEADAAMMVAENLRRGIEEIRLDAYPEVRATVSIGIASFPRDAGDGAALMAKADEALYRAKESGKNRSVAYR